MCNSEHTARSHRTRSAGLLAAGALACAFAVSVAFADGAHLQYDANGNVIQRIGPSGTTTYGYDALNRLIQEAGPAKTQSITYDANGNRLSDGAGNITYSPTSNRIATRLGATLSYDAAGHLTSDGSGKTYRYNQAGQLSQVLQGSTVLASYYYNYQGERTRKVTTAAAPQGAQTVLYHYDQFGQLSVESRDDGTPIRTYVWRDDAPIAQIDYLPSRRILYYEVDHLNTPRAASDQNGKIVWRWESDAFGSTLPNEDPDGDGVKTTVNLRLPGQYFDQESGLHYNYFRDYDPKVGRYVQSDPIGLAGGINPYQYANANPLSFIDQFGLTCISLNSRMTCAVPGGGPTFTVPSPRGQPKNLGPNSSFYHETNVSRDLNGADPKCVFQELVNSPTPGKPSPATPGGTPNNAIPPYYPLNNSVRSYTTTAHGSGIPIVVNTAGEGDGSAFGPGYVARYVEGGRVYTRGEGTNPQQYFGPSDWANEQLWGADLERVIKKCKCR